mmetsp:Transcript_3519/g.5289  ORF Transcript_3519/g.5289 Transcript_3519/m.5289 type:complete len:135 (-) Transcript_3519:119-523(-)
MDSIQKVKESDQVEDPEKGKQPAFNMVTTAVIMNLPTEKRHVFLMDDEDSKENEISTDSYNDEGEDTEFNPKIDKFESSSQYYLSCIGFLVGFPNFFRFIKNVKLFGGSTFLIPYFTCMLVVGFPLVVLDTALG